jgi:head-tail adaptor
MLKKKIIVERWETDKDANGNNYETLEVRYPFWAEVRRTGGSRSSLNGKTNMGEQMVFTIEFRPDWYVTGDWRVVFRGRRFTVQSIERADEDRFKWIITTTGR